ncbi:MAG: hypothetical protein ACRDJO_11010 [Actinomycetota bacterium]
MEIPRPARRWGAVVTAAGLLLGACAGDRSGSRARGTTTPSPAASANPGNGTVFGAVKVREGNCLPGPVPEPRQERPNPCRTQAVATRVAAFPPISRTGATGDLARPTVGTPVAATRSAPDGAYEIALPPGRYSVLADDDGRPYCNSFTSEGTASLACVVDVQAGRRTQFDVTINHAFD